jgi:hypothetical protein
VSRPRASAEARAEAREAAKTAGRSRKSRFPIPEAARHAGEGLQQIREESRKRLAAEEKLDAAPEE